MAGFSSYNTGTVTDPLGDDLNFGGNDANNVGALEATDLTVDNQPSDHHWELLDEKYGVGGTWDITLNVPDEYNSERLFLEFNVQSSAANGRPTVSMTFNNLTDSGYEEMVETSSGLVGNTGKSQVDITTINDLYDGLEGTYELLRPRRYLAVQGQAVSRYATGDSLTKASYSAQQSSMYWDNVQLFVDNDCTLINARLYGKKSRSA